jgi:hypothetical protein
VNKLGHSFDLIHSIELTIPSEIPAYKALQEISNVFGGHLIYMDIPLGKRRNTMQVGRRSLPLLGSRHKNFPLLHLVIFVCLGSSLP